MEINQPKFFIIGDSENVSQVLNKLPNKNKLYNNYLYDINEPFVEYGFYLQKEDEENNAGNFRIIVCPDEIHKYHDKIFENSYFKNITALIICHNNNFNKNFDKLDTKETIHIWFDKDFINMDLHDKDLHYLIDDNNWINRIYNHLEIPFTPPINTECHIL